MALRRSERLRCEWNAAPGYDKEYPRYLLLRVSLLTLCVGIIVMIDPILALEGPRVRLEPLERRHLPDLRKNGANPAIWEFSSGNNRFLSESAAEDWFADATAGNDRHTFAIVDKATGEAIGSTRYGEIVPEHRKLEIGWTFITPRYWRTHVNTECKFLLLEYAFEQWGAQRVQLRAQAINSRSRNAISRIGATYEGTMRSFVFKAETGEVRDTVVYSIITPEWPAVKERLASRLNAELRTP